MKGLILNRFVLVGALLMMLGVFGAAPKGASAASTTALSASAMCTQVDGGEFICNGSASGGTGGYTYKWTGGNGVVITRGANYINAAGTCVVGTKAYVYFTVTDSSGAKVTVSRNFSCYNVAP